MRINNPANEELIADVTRVLDDSRRRESGIGDDAI